MSMDRKKRLQELLDKQKQKQIEEDEKREFEYFLEELSDLFPDYIEENIEILSVTQSQNIIANLFDEFPFTNSGIDWNLMNYKAIFSNYIDYESALVELLIKNLRTTNVLCYIIDFRYQYVIKAELSKIIPKVDEVRRWDRYIYSPELKLVIEFPSNDIAVGWKKYIFYMSPCQKKHI